MRSLIDTHSFLWFIEGDGQISLAVTQLIEDPGNDVYLSAASLWEIAVKMAIGKLHLPQPYHPYIPDQIALNGFTVLPILTGHANIVSTLPFPDSKHRDPFDRLIISQAIFEGMPILSKDAKFDRYQVKRIW